MIHYNYDCDFKIAEQLIADAPFRYTYYAKNEKTVVAEYDGTDYHGCYPMGDMLIVPINAGSLGLGEVKVRREYFLTDKDFTDGICNRVTGNVPLGIEIWRGETDGMETHEVKVVPAYQKGDPFTFDDMTDAQKQDIADRVPTKEPEREAAEILREEHEETRQRNEASRQTAEEDRQQTFIANEANREQIFLTNESLRQENETKREEAETIREATYKNKVDRDDNAPKLTAGFANNLVGRGEATPQEISFRPSGGDTSIEDGTARIDRLKGSTVVWNQLLKCEFTNGETYGGTVKPTVQDGKGYLTFTATGESFTTSFNATTNHYYLWEAKLSASTGCRLFMHSYGVLTTLSASTDMKVVQGIVRYTSSSAEKTVMLLPISNITEPTDIVVDYYRLYDLTQMFGAGNEPTTIEEFNARKPIGIDEHAYNEGELISTNVEELKSVGFNAWDEEWEVGVYSNANGTKHDINERIRCKSYIPCLPNTSYYYAFSVSGRYLRICYYDANKNFISALNDVYWNYAYTTPVGAYYLTFSVTGYTITTYNNDICIHLVHTGYRNGEYEPYKEFRRNIPIKDIKDSEGNQLFPNGLLSAGSVYDEITATKAIKRVGMVDMGTLKWTRIVEGQFLVNIPDKKETIGSHSQISDLACAKYAAGRKTYYSNSDEGDKVVCESISTSSLTFVKVVDSSYADVATFKAAMSGVMLYYELAEPIEVDLPEPLNLDYEVSDFGTEEVISDVPTTPMKADIIYQFNAVDRIRDNSRHTAEAEIKLKDYETRIAALEAIVTSLTSGEV